MSTIIETHIECDGCGKRAGDGKGWSSTQLRMMFMSRWLCIPATGRGKRDGRDYCPECRAKHEGRKP